MKSRVKRIVLSLFAACTALIAVISGAVLLRDRNSARAAGDATTTVTFAADKTELVAGGEFELTITVESLRDNTNLEWSALTFYIGALNSDGKTYDGNISQYLSVTAHEVKDLEEDVDYSDTSSYYFKEGTGDDGKWMAEFTSPLDANALLISMSTIRGKTISAGNQFVYTIKLRVAKNYDVANYGTFTFGMQALKKNGAKVYDSVQKITSNDLADTGAFAATNSLTFTVRDASEDNTLKDLEVGHDSSALTSLAVPGDAEDDPSVVPDASEYTFNFDDLTSFYVKPTANDENAKIGVAINQQVTFTDVTPGNSEKLTIVDPSTLTDGDHNMLYVQVTAENGTAKTYSVTVKMGYVRLNSITASASTATSGVTKNGLDLSATSDTYDKDTFAYDVFVPSDYDADGGSVTLNASVLTGYDASTTIALAGTGCDPMQLDGATATSQLTSGGTVLLKNLAFPVNDGDAKPTLTLTATASDGVTTQVYTLTFIKVSVDADLDTITVTGIDTSKVFDSDATQATANGVDYYYLLIGETQKKASVAIAAKSAVATVGVDWTDDTITETLPDYANPTTYGEGGYTITIEAEAGNTKTYKFIIAAALYLKLVDGSQYQFITEREEDDEEFYRRAYDEIGWKHGEDDLELETVVLGQVSPNTTVNAFLENIDPAQLSMLKIYDQDGEAIYVNGQPADGIDEEELDDADSYTVGTGWRVEYGTDDSADVVYVSVLGDVDGDGLIASFDVADINYQIMGRDVVKVKFAKVYVRLACYVENEMGAISSFDVAILNYVIMGRSKIEDYFYKPAATPED